MLFPDVMICNKTLFYDTMIFSEMSFYAVMICNKILFLDVMI